MSDQQQYANHVANLFGRMLDTLDRMQAQIDRLEQKIDHMIEIIHYDMEADECDDADIAPFGRERNGHDTL